MAPTHVIIDTDPGIDDTFALLVALASQDELVIDALTIVMGNHSDVDILAENACRILSWCGARNIPVVRGAREPLARDYSGESGIKVHGDDGLGGIRAVLGPADTTPLNQYANVSAAQFIVDHTKEAGHPVAIITLGPLTNLARAVQLDPSIVQRVPAVYTMGGAVNVRGNKTPMAEANVHNDPESARIVFTCGFNLTLTALNVTRQLELSDDFRAQVRDTCGAVGHVLYDISHHYVNLLRGWGNTQIPIHDPTAIMSLLRPDLFESEEVHIDVETEGTLTAGVTCADWMGHWGPKDSKVKVLTKVDKDAYMVDLLARLQRAGQIAEQVGILKYSTAVN